MFKKKVMARALAVTFSLAATSVAMLPEAYAQSNTTGSIFGKVDSPTGASVSIDNTSGYHRVAPVDANGRFAVPSVPTGDYSVSLMRGGKTEKTINDVSVKISSGAEVNFLATERIQVVGSSGQSLIDVSSTNNGVVFSAKELEKLPVATNVGAVIQLAPSTVKGDPRYGGLGAPSFGGASAAENAYYINGFPVTNALTQVGFSSLPFGAMAQMQVLEGGYGAEFGRSTGGVVNITTKSGTNTWEVGGAVQYSPNSWASTPKNIIYPTTGSTVDGKIRQYLAGDKVDRWTYNVEAGGPIIKDKLFIYANFEANTLKTQTTRVVDTDPTSAAVGWQERKLDQPRYLVKLDWNITNDHHIEWTSVRDDPKDTRSYFGFDYKTLTRNYVNGGGVTYKNYGPTPIAATNGGDLDILKYTGNLTQDLIVTALVGKTKTPREQVFQGYNAAMPLITVTDGAPGIKYVSNQNYNTNVLGAGAYSETSGYRVDLEYRINDKHTVRGGLDNNDLKAKAGDETPGGIEYRYESLPCTDKMSIPGSPLVPQNLKSADGKTCYYVYSHYFNAINNAKTTQAAQYVEDRWQINDKVLLVLGLRNEQFKNLNDAGQVFVKQDNQWEPRVAATWDVNGDSKTKVFGNAGRYHIQLPTNVAIRGAGASTFMDQYFSYTGINPATGAPTGTTALGPRFSPDGEVGLPKDPSYVAASGLKSHYQDELALGMERAISKGLNVGGKVTYRRLGRIIEDWCDDRPIRDYATKVLGMKSTKLYDATVSCFSINPGETNTFDLDIDGDGKKEHVVLTPDMMGNFDPTKPRTTMNNAMPKAERTYLALDFFAEHPFDGKWYGKVNYTWSRAKGNTEGQLNSDLGQADPAATVSFDFKELTENSNGRLPNDRTHVIKAYGFYAVTPEWGVGGNLFLASGRPTNCLGAYPDPSNYAAGQYGPAIFFYCNGGKDSPRGTYGHLPNQQTLDVNVSYKPDWFKGLKFQVDVYNLFNQQVADQIRERATPTNRFGIIEAYTPARSAKFTAAYNKKF
ncbi:MAG: TonB-dependent receptor [Proteobacteria bacterium]|nr:TonB-dependent receptor [Pseudomonadota bacterium]